MLSYIFVILFALVCSLAVCNLVSSYSPNGEEAEPLSPMSWVICSVLFVGVNLALYLIGWAWIPIGFLAAILAAECFLEFDKEGSNVAATTAIPFAVTTILCLAKEADKNDSPKTLWLVVIPVLMLVAIFLVGKFKAIPAGKRKDKLIEKLTPGNIISGVLVCAAVIAVIAFIKEVLLK